MGIKTENLCILFTDIAGFTEASTNLSREANERLLRTHNELLLPVVRGFKGRHVKSIGDALLLTFRSPTDAMLCAMAMQDTLHGYNIDREEREQIHVRIAASLGEVRVTKNDIFGDPVNLTSRIEGITPPDEIYLSEAVYLAMNKAEVPVREVGFREVKGLSAPVKIFCIPRYASARLVADESSSVPDSRSVQFPFGGAHLLTKRNESSWRMVGHVSVMEMPKRHGWALLGVTLLLLSGIATYFGLQTLRVGENSNRYVKARLSEPNYSQSSSSLSAAAASSVASKQMAAVVSSLLERYTVDRSSASASEAAAVSSAARSSSIAMQVRSASRAAQSRSSLSAERAAVQRAAQQPTRPLIRSITAAKLAYRAGQLTKEQYRTLVDKLDDEYEAAVEKLKSQYRAGTITKPEYSDRVRALKLALRG